MTKMIHDALADADAIKRDLRALNIAMDDAKNGLTNDNLQHQMADYCASLATMDERMEKLIQTIRFVMHDADVKAAD